jgi:hypothetical protein
MTAAVVRARVLRLPAAGVAAVLALAWLVAAPPTPDLGAALYRGRLFAEEGFALYDLGWYGGHHLPGYSLLAPAAGWLLGVRPAAAVGAVLSAALFERVATAHWGRSARPAVLLYAIATVTDLLIGRVTYGLGVAAGLGALLALQRGRPGAAVVLASACSATSPVAGLFLALAASAAFLARPRDRRPLGVAVAATVVVAALAILFPEGGAQPCPPGSLAAVLGGSALLVAVADPREGAIRIGGLLYALAGTLAFLLPTPMGSNVSRLGAGFALALIAGLVATRPTRLRVRRTAVVAGCAALVAWQWWAPVREVSKASDASYGAAYHAPLLAFLAGDAGATPVRVEVPFTRAHMEAVHVAPHRPLARGWQTQLDRKYNPLFYDDGALTAERYERWLRRNAVTYVALPDAPLDPAGAEEAAIVASRPSFLLPVWSNAHWRVFRVRRAVPLVSGDATLISLGPEGFVLRATGVGEALVRVRFTPYWTATGGACLSRAPGGWTAVTLRRTGRVHVGLRFSLRRALRGPGSCAA